MTLPRGVFACIERICKSCFIPLDFTIRRDEEDRTSFPTAFPFIDKSKVLFSRGSLLFITKSMSWMFLSHQTLPELSCSAVDSLRKISGTKPYDNLHSPLRSGIDGSKQARLSSINHHLQIRQAGYPFDCVA
jgi:hypothetical protein